MTLFKCPSIANAGVDNCIFYMKKRMKEEYITYWSNYIKKSENEGGKLELYSKIKQNFMMEPYLKQVRQFKLRKAMTAFRISAHKLEIETGRYIKSKKDGKYVHRNDRICTICKEHNILVTGDEEHALTSCVGFLNERNRLFRYFEEKEIFEGVR